MLKNRLIKQENGSIAVYAVATILSFILILGGVFFTSSVIRKNQLRTLLKIKEVYIQEPDITERAFKGRLVPANKRAFDYIEDDSEYEVPVPGGYCVVKDSKSGEENTIESGLVISDLEGDTLDNEEIIVNGEKKRGNQFVWVPVPDASVIYGVDNNNQKHGKLYTFTQTGKTNLNWTETNGIMTITNSDGNREPDVVTGTTGSEYDASIEYLKIIADLENKTAEGFKALLQKEFDSMIESVEKYGGFYIGRYETGFLLDSSNNKKISVVQKGATVGGANWYYQYQEIKNIAKGNKNVTSSMIWGCQWDRALEWIAQTNTTAGTPNYSLLTDSKSWGNYGDSEGAAATDSRSLQTSGTNDTWQKNHIYDLAGNAWDLTIESIRTTSRICRGGSCYYTNSPASCRDNGSDPSYGSYVAGGSRSTMYINP